MGGSMPRGEKRDGMMWRVERVRGVEDLGYGEATLVCKGRHSFRCCGVRWMVTYDEFSRIDVIRLDKMHAADGIVLRDELCHNVDTEADHYR